MTTGGAWSMKMREEGRKKPHLLPLNGGWCCFPTQEQISQKVPPGYGKTPVDAWCNMWNRHLDLFGAIVVLEEPPPLVRTEFKAGQDNEWKGKWRWFR